MSGVVPNRKSFGNKSNKSTGSRKATSVNRCFWKPTISSQLKRRQMGLLTGDEENESLTDTIGKTSTISKKKSPAVKKMPVKSPLKPTSKFNSSMYTKRQSPIISRLQKPAKKVMKSVIKPIEKKENVIKPSVAAKNPSPKPASRKLDYNPKPIEGIDCKFEIPSNLMKKRDQKASEKAENESNKGSSKEFADITNQNIDGISSSTPMRCITGKSSVVRSEVSFLNSAAGSGKSTPNITPYKMMRRNKENGKDGSNKISNLELKIKELEEQILQSKVNKDDEEDEENNEFLDGMSQIDGNKLILETKKFRVVKEPEPESNPIEERIPDLKEDKPESVHQSEKAESEHESQEQIPEIQEEIEEVQEEIKVEEKEEEEEADEIKELENMIGQVFSTIKKDQKLSITLQDKIKAYENLTTDLIKSVKVNDNENDFKSPENINSASCKSRKSTQKRRNRPGRRRRSNRHKKTYDSIDLYHDNN